jgi:hypothetical protein
MHKHTAWLTVRRAVTDCDAANDEKSPLITVRRPAVLYWNNAFGTVRLQASQDGIFYRVGYFLANAQSLTRGTEGRKHGPTDSAAISARARPVEQAASATLRQFGRALVSNNLANERPPPIRSWLPVGWSGRNSP